jgi:putative CocE/NonD family hydrolase
MFNANIKDSYQFFLKLGAVKNANSSKYFNNKAKIWNEYLAHETYDTYWKERNIRPHLRNVKPATLVVGGWFDAEDLFGALRTYEAIEKQTPNNNNRLVMGPWTHGAWARPDWSKYATHEFGSNTAKYFQELQLRFFNFYLKDKGSFEAAEATVFETGSNQWRTYTQWPPQNTTEKRLYFNANGTLSFDAPKGDNIADSYLSDPARPVPYIDNYRSGRDNEYMAADQRFASRRPDVLSYRSEVLTEDITLSGTLIADLFVAMTGTDADFIVKLIDVLPDSAKTLNPNPKGIQMAGMERLVRAEVMRGKFRNSFEKPEAFVPNKVTEVKFSLPDVAHTFKKGHQIMVQVQSSWFPLVDRNPQKFINIPQANNSDFQKSTIKIYNSSTNASHLRVQVSNP